MDLRIHAKGFGEMGDLHRAGDAVIVFGVDPQEVGAPASMKSALGSRPRTYSVSSSGVVSISRRFRWAKADYRIHAILTERAIEGAIGPSPMASGIQFADLPKDRSGPTARWHGHPFDRTCQSHGLVHRLTQPNHPWTKGQVERVNRTIKEAAVKRYHCDSHDQLRRRLADFLAAYNFARRLKTLGGLTPCEYIRKVWTSEPNRFILDPIHQMPGLNN